MRAAACHLRSHRGLVTITRNRASSPTPCRGGLKSLLLHKTSGFLSRTCQAPIVLQCCYHANMANMHSPRSQNGLTCNLSRTYLSVSYKSRNICWVHEEEQQRRSIAPDRTLAQEVSPCACKKAKSHQLLAILSASQIRL